MEFRRTRGSRSRSIGITWEDTIPPGVENPLNSGGPWNFGQNKWDQKLGKIKCVFSLQDKMRWKWDNVYLLQGQPNIYSPSLYPALLPLYLHTPAITPWWSTWRLWSRENGDTRRGRDLVDSEAVIVSVRKYTWGLWSSKGRDALGGRVPARFEMHLEAIILRTWRP